MKALEKILLTIVVLLGCTLGLLIWKPAVADDLKSGWVAVHEKLRNVETEEPAVKKQGVSGENYDFSDASDVYYQMLDENGKKLYAQFYANAAAMNPVFTVDEDIEGENVETIFQSVYYDHPELFWLENNYTYQYDVANGKVLSITMAFNDLSNDQSRQAFESAADEILAQAEQGESDYEKEKAVHDALLSIGTYDLNAPDNQSAYSLLVNHRSVCAGFARSFQYLMNRLGILTYYVVGTSEGQDHAWNMVMLDGQFYNVDVTWDDAAEDTDPYYFFNLADEEFNVYHARSGLSLNLPACTSTEYSHREDASFYQYYHFVPASDAG